MKLSETKVGKVQLSDQCEKHDDVFQGIALESKTLPAEVVRLSTVAFKEEVRKLHFYTSVASFYRTEGCWAA